MIDARFEIDRLTHTLRFKGISNTVIESIVANVNQEIALGVTDLIADAVADAVKAGEDVGSEEFMSEVRSARAGGTFMVTTQSGQTDFSEPPFPMLPRLLKNAKVAKDGSTYKVIPLNSKKTVKRATNSMDIMEQINSNREAAKRVRVRETRDPLAMATAFSGMAVNNRGSGRGKRKQDVKAPTGTANFRTVSSKQDPSSQWVNPGKQANMTGVLRNINSELQQNIDQTILDIVRSYEEMY